MQQLSFPALPQSVRLVCRPWLRTHLGFCFCLFLPLILAAVGAVFLEEETHLFMSFVYCYCLPSIQILPFNFLWFQFPFLAFLPFIPALVFSSQDCIHDWHMLLPLSAHKARGPDYLSDSFGAKPCVQGFLLYLCSLFFCDLHFRISVSASAFSPFSLPCHLPEWGHWGDQHCPVVSQLSVCLWAASNLHHVHRFWNIFRVGIFFLCSVAFRKGIWGSYTHSNTMTVIFVQTEERVFG